METNRNTLRENFLGVEAKIKLLNGNYSTAINFDNAATTPPLKAVFNVLS